MNLHDEIAAIAYELYESRGCVRGRDLDDWLDAERIVLGRHSGQDIEEPEEEETSEEMAAAIKVSVERTAPEENEESYNEEMS
jgi:Protein of unknown function (DUF2934)